MTTITIALPADLKKQIQQKAKTEGLTLSGLTIQLYKSFAAGQLTLGFTPVLIATQAAGAEKPSKLTLNLLQKEVNKMPDDEKIVLGQLAKKAKSMDTLMQDTGWDIPRLSLALVYLELKGIITEKNGMWGMC